MQSGAGVSDTTRVIAALVDAESRPIVQLARVNHPAMSVGGEDQYMLGLADARTQTGTTWMTVGSVNLELTSVEHVLLAGVSALAMHQVREADVQLGDPVLVVGSDPWSLLLLHWARLQGASPLVFAARRSPRLIELAAAAGVDADLADPTPADMARAVRSTYRGAGFAVVLDAVGNEQSVTQAMPAVRDGGRYVVASLHPARHVSLNAYPDLHRRDLEMISHTPVPADPEFRSMVRFALELTRETRLILKDILDPALGWRAVSS